MNSESFAYLFIHAHSIAELEIEHVAAEIAGFGDDDDPFDDMSAEEREALALAQMGSMDPSMADGLVWETPEHEAEARRSLAALEQEGPAPEAGEPSDPGLYLARAYAARAQLQERIDRASGRIDHAALERLLADLPPGLAPLTQALDGAQFGQWFDCHQDGNPPLNTLVTMLVCA